jgi:hypothetical protein
MSIHGEKRRKKQHAREARVLIIAHNRREESREEKQVFVRHCCDEGCSATYDVRSRVLERSLWVSLTTE